MKFQHLPIGARFEYEGQTYVKNGPLTASSEHSGQRLIPRYAHLKPLDGFVSQAKSGPGSKLDEAAVLAAFEAFYQTCTRLSDDSGAFELAGARQKFLEKLGLNKI